MPRRSAELAYMLHACVVSCLVTGACTSADSAESSGDSGQQYDGKIGDDGESWVDGSHNELPTGETSDVGDTATANGETRDEIVVPGGIFWMGCNEAKDTECTEPEYPQHLVSISTFSIDRTETTRSAYVACIDDGACPSLPTVPDDAEASERPVANVDWSAAATFCKWSGGRLCTEAEWEFAARGGCDESAPDNLTSCKDTTRVFPWGDEQPSCELAVFRRNSEGCFPPTCTCGAEWGSFDVGSKPEGASPFGVLDMAGNVSEWVADVWDPEYFGTFGDEMAFDPTGPESDSPNALRVVKGGNFKYPDVRSSARVGNSPILVDDGVGFRCCSDVIE